MNQVERLVPYGAERGRCNGKDKVRTRNPKLFRRPHLLGIARGEDEEERGEEESCELV